MPTINSPHKILERVNLPRIICTHLLGEHHSSYHRMGAGLVVMAVGVLTSKVAEGYIIIHFFFDVFGYMIHGIGTIPFVELLSAQLPTQSEGD